MQYRPLIHSGEQGDSIVADDGRSVPGYPLSGQSMIYWLFTILPLYGLGCAKVHHVAASQPALVKPAALRGFASITILTSSAAGTKPEGSKYEEVVPPTPIGELKPPIYPEKALKAKYGQAIVAIRVFLDAGGRVTDLKDAPTAASTGGPFASEFRSAVEDAIHLWKFRPAEYRRYADGKDLNGDGKPDYMVLIAKENVPVYFDVRFDFSIVKGQGHVK
ncbi:MAG TPA: hypothetical protein VE398_18830 [Acidobacteriota bacterium]|nr:hypothetical protein [Acidobacteriota bacterium]